MQGNADVIFNSYFDLNSYGSIRYIK